MVMVFARADTQEKGFPAWDFAFPSREKQFPVRGFCFSTGEKRFPVWDFAFPTRPLQDIRGRDDSRIAIGQTGEGRYLRVIYVPDPVPDSVFVITAYELGPKAKRAIRRRRKKKR